MGVLEAATHYAKYTPYYKYKEVGFPPYHARSGSEYSMVGQSMRPLLMVVEKL